MANSISGQVAEHLGDHHKASIDTLQAGFEIALEGIEKLTWHQFASARDGLEESLEHGKQLLAARDVGEWSSLHGQYVQRRFGDSLSHLRGLNEIAWGVREDLLKLFERGHGELNKSVESLLDRYAQSSGHPEVAVAAVRSAVSAANNAFANARQAARQVADIASTSVTAVSSATPGSKPSPSGSNARSKKAA